MFGFEKSFQSFKRLWKYEYISYRKYLEARTPPPPPWKFKHSEFFIVWNQQLKNKYKERSFTWNGKAWKEAIHEASWKEQVFFLFFGGGDSSKDTHDLILKKFNIMVSFVNHVRCLLLHSNSREGRSCVCSNEHTAAPSLPSRRGWLESHSAKNTEGVRIR